MDNPSSASPFPNFLSREREFYNACRDGDLPKVQLLAGQVNVSWEENYGSTGFMIACYKGWKHIVKYLLSVPAVDVNKAENYDLATPLFVACEFGEEEIVELLLNHPRVRVNDENHHGQTPLFVSCVTRNEKMVKRLLADARVDVNKPTRQGVTPLLAICEREYEEILVRLLKDERVDVNKANLDGKTPLHVACSLRKEKFVKLIMASGKNIDLTRRLNTGFKKTAADLARELGSKKITQLLDTYAINRKAAILELRKELKWNTKEAEIFVLGILLCDDYYSLKAIERQSRIGRFFSIFTKLHFDLQQVLVNRGVGNFSNFIPSVDINRVLSSLIFAK